MWFRIWNSYSEFHTLNSNYFMISYIYEKDFSLQSCDFNFTPKQKIKVWSGSFIRRLGEVIDLVGK